MRSKFTPTLVLASSLCATLLLAAAPSQSPPTPTARPAAPSATTPSASSSTYAIDPVHSKALFRIQHAGAGMFWGRFNDVTGSFTCDNGKPEGAMFDVTIKVDSIDTGIDKLDNHLKTNEFFDAAAYPTMAFKSTSVKKGSRDKTLDVTGDFTMHGVTKPITATVEWIGTAEMMGSRSGYEAVVTIKRSDWGMKYGVDKGMLGDDVRLIVSLEGTAKK